MRFKWLLWCVGLPMMAIAQERATPSVKRALTACERQQDAQACWALSQRYAHGKGVQRHHYYADAYSYKACLYETQLSVAKRYCEQAISRTQTWTNGKCMERNIYHRLCEQGSRAYCEKMAALARQGWRGQKEVCGGNQESLGDGTPQPSLAVEYEKKALVAPFD